MNQIPNIEEVLENFNKAFPLSIDYPETPKPGETQARWHIEVENRTNRAKNIRHHQLIWLRSLLTTHNHQLQKAREKSGKRNAVVKEYKDEGVMFILKVEDGKTYEASMPIPKWAEVGKLQLRDHSELDQDTLEDKE